MGQDLVEAVKAAGVIGAGGAGFPTHVKLAARVDTVIANGAECDPLLQCDQRLMECRAAEIVRGLQLAMEATGATRGIVALKKEYRKATAALQRAASVAHRGAGSQQALSLHLLDSRYPAGDEFVLVYETTGRLVPEAGLPLHVGCLVQNVQTLFNIQQAATGRPVTHRLLTVTGAVTRPVTLWAPVGTPMCDVLAWAGGIRLPVGHCAAGKIYRRSRRADDGPVRLALTSLDQNDERVARFADDNVVVRYLTRSRKSWVRRGISTCDQCRDCTDLCPRYLLGHDLKPHEVMRAINYGLERPADKVTAAILCCECRLCEAYACPLELSPMSYYVAIKEQLKAQGWRPEKRQDGSGLKPHAMRDCRLVPTHRLIARLGLTEWEEQVCPLDETDYRPARVTIPLRHPRGIGVPAMPVVAAGQTVATGDPIALIPEGKLGANVHASITGRVSQVTEAIVEITA